MSKYIKVNLLVRHVTLQVFKGYFRKTGFLAVFHDGHAVVFFDIDILFTFLRQHEWNWEQCFKSFCNVSWNDSFCVKRPFAIRRHTTVIHVFQNTLGAETFKEHFKDVSYSLITEHWMLFLEFIILYKKKKHLENHESMYHVEVKAWNSDVNGISAMQDFCLVLWTIAWSKLVAFPVHYTTFFICRGW